MRFAAVDVETANPKWGSICQIGVALFQAGQEVQCWEALVDPDDLFAEFNIGIHGITQARVAGLPRFPHAYEELQALVQGVTIVSHSMFDRTALAQACARYQLPQLENEWLDTARVARHAWSKFSATGWGLKHVAKHLQIEFDHHNALDDARAAGTVLLKAQAKTGLDLVGLRELAARPIVVGTRIPDGDELLVFTGKLSMKRKRAEAVAIEAGLSVSSRVTKWTTMVVCGDQDLSHLATGQDKSKKHRAAEAAVANGQELRIVRESDFLALVENRRIDSSAGEREGDR
jgi:DNA polymerase III subunit epsilon